MKKLLRGWFLAVLGVLLAAAVFAFPPSAPQTSYSPSAVAITGGAIDGTAIGGTTPADATFNDVTLSATKHLLLPLHNDGTTPTLAFGDGDSGFFEEADDGITVSLGASNKYKFSVSSFYAYQSNGFILDNATPTATDPNIQPNRSDTDTGYSWAAADQLSLVAGGVEGMRISEAATTETEVFGRLVTSDTALFITTEVNITDPLSSSVILITGDDDTDNDAIDLQNGETAGQHVYLLVIAAVDADDTITINMADTTCTNCPAIVFNKVGENAHLIWSGATWIAVSLQTGL